MVVHELGHAGSALPKMESVIEVNRGEDKNGQEEVKERKVPLHKHIFRSLYIAYLSILQQNYSQFVVTYGAMMNFARNFILYPHYHCRVYGTPYSYCDCYISVLVFPPPLTIYVSFSQANLAAILSQKPDFATVDTLEEAQTQGLKICAERKTLEIVIVQSLYPHIANKVFVNDPGYLGGDDLPGLNCPNCQSHRRVFDMIDPVKARKNSSFCDMALAP